MRRLVNALYTYYPASASSFNNVQKITEYGFNNEELRRTEMTYETAVAYEDQGLLHLPLSVLVYPGGSTIAASRVEYVYDGSTPAPCNDIKMVDSSYSGINARGNVTSVKTYPDAATAGTPIINTATYDVAGNVLTQTADCCLQKAFTYSPAYNYAYMTQMARGNSGQLTSGASYDLNTGLARTTTDENSQITSFDYDANTLRPHQTTRPDGGYTRLEYGDALVSDPDATHMHSFVKSVNALDSGREVSSWQYMDGRGAVARSFVLTPNGYVTSDIEYDMMGRAYRTGNPYYSTSGPLSPINSAGLWTTSEYDDLGRVKTVTTADGNLQNNYNVVHFNYAGSAVVGSTIIGDVVRQLQKGKKVDTGVSCKN